MSLLIGKFDVCFKLPAPSIHIESYSWTDDPSSVSRRSMIEMSCIQITTKRLTSTASLPQISKQINTTGVRSRRQVSVWPWPRPLPWWTARKCPQQRVGPFCFAMPLGQPQWKENGKGLQMKKMKKKWYFKVVFQEDGWRWLKCSEKKKTTSKRYVNAKVTNLATLVPKDYVAYLKKKGSLVAPRNRFAMRKALVPNKNHMPCGPTNRGDEKLSGDENGLLHDQPQMIAKQNHQ